MTDYAGLFRRCPRPYVTKKRVRGKPWITSLAPDVRSEIGTHHLKCEASLNRHVRWNEILDFIVVAWGRQKTRSCCTWLSGFVQACAACLETHFLPSSMHVLELSDKPLGLRGRYSWHPRSVQCSLRKAQVCWCWNCLFEVCLSFPSELFARGTFIF